ncbi:MAG TPA: MlaD family protein [Acidobacteriota bacterium]|nr:MlaD family protein [Acidobacteriota bacterium]
MNSKSKATLSELKVGIFVVIACIILAVAIFTIGTQVGLLEETFIAKTYLNTVSGLKPGDVVLLGGVEVGNVIAVNITKPGEVPQTPANQVNLRLIADGQAQIDNFRSQSANLKEQLLRARLQYNDAVTQYGDQSAAAQRLQAEIEKLEDQARRFDRQADQLQDDIDDARANIQSIEVYLQILSQYRDWIRADSNISLGSVGLLGDRYIEISLGRTTQPPPVEKEEVDTFFGTDTREVVVITGTRQAGFQELITGANDILANFEVLSERLQEIMAKFEEGEGSVGRFFSDPAFYNNLNAAVVGAREAVEQASQMMKDITQGPGTVPRLIQERELYDKIASATDRLEKMIARIEEGDGTVGRLVTDEALYTRTTAVMGNIEGITGRIDKGQGTLGKLSTDEKLYEELRVSISQMKTFMEDVEQGKGTLGKLAKDPELYQNMNQLSAEMVKLLYDFRQNPKKFLTIKFEIF